MAYVNVGGIQVKKVLFDAVEKGILPGTGIESDRFWSGLGRLLDDFAPLNEALLRKRDAMQAQIDAWTLENCKKSWDSAAYTSFLAKIGYLVPEGRKFKVDTTNVDDEISITPGPQLVVPVDNARYSLNAANARWGSLLDAFYGTDAGPPTTDGAEQGKAYNPVRGKRVFEYAHAVLDTHFPLATGPAYGEVASHNDVVDYEVVDGRVLRATLKSGITATLQDQEKFVGYNLDSTGATAKSILFRNNGLHIELQIDRTSSVGKTHPAGVKDIVVESAITAIADCEDSVAAVDAEDKAKVYLNWAGLMKGTLSEEFTKDGKTSVRKLNKDKEFASPTGDLGYPTMKRLPGRAVLLVRNVGMHLMTDMILQKNGAMVPEGLCDAMITTLAAMHDFSPNKPADLKNSRAGSMYIVKPKLHGPEEVEFTVDLFKRVEEELGLEENTIKMGIMDEERRTTVNLFECIRAAKHRCIFINTGFLDRTGDEIHTSFYAGPMMPKDKIKTAPWRVAYENWNVDIGLEVGLAGRGQIGKGMWAKPDEMAAMLKEKSGHLKAGATCAWVPSPTAATLHALHYHETDVLGVQKQLASRGRAKLSDILLPPLLSLSGQSAAISNEEIKKEMEDAAQGILGYVVRWVQLGVGCSKVPDTNNVGLMEDRATLRISSQLIANWVHHGVVSLDEVMGVFKRMAQVVDRQNAGSKGYKPMTPHYTDNGFRCAVEMILDGKRCPNGLTEHTLTRFRLLEKAAPAGRSKL